MSEERIFHFPFSISHFSLEIALKQPDKDLGMLRFGQRKESQFEMTPKGVTMANQNGK